MSAGGGAVEDFVQLWASVTDVLPDGTHALATSRERGTHLDYADIVVLDLETGETESLQVTGYDPRWLPTGHLMFGRAGSVFAVPFDPARRTVAGEPVIVRRDVATDGLWGYVQLAVSASGTLAYIPGADVSRGEVVAIDRRDNRVRTLPLPPGQYGSLDLSPDDRTLAIHVYDVNDYILLYDLERETARKLSGSDRFGYPAWSRDGQKLSSSSMTLGVNQTE